MLEELTVTAGIVYTEAKGYNYREDGAKKKKVVFLNGWDHAPECCVWYNIGQLEAIWESSFFILVDGFSTLLLTLILL